ncbi:MAG: hypothetical protein A2918_02215 [Candidatus Yanofskybacteria bacterium RIFCSPLOWO2_01_FULL_42_49]|uniref:Peptidase C39-like domain-containing protein n=1 Tax=Candidatus Yanofskybacteria bacterium RIFCSPLOWO2_01_FULL_42_49 TaxID=1802694 RepID=A0A1F8GB48_9BACT|nr:MAG: hypothetical protein A2918_02215 [Candidatus Yanofskybacteria bacterium RIFCSPLOWO2_01_FULL_42_49]
MAEVKLVNQITDAGDESWSKHSCGICVIKMLMVFKNQKFQSIPIMTLLSQAFNAGGYIKNIGWKHQALVDLAASYGVPMNFQKEFFNTPEKKKEGIKMINNQLSILKSPVAVSVLKEFNLSDTAHLVIVEKIKKLGPFVLGYHIADPYPGKRGNRYVVSKKEFLAGWRGGMLWLE